MILATGNNGKVKEFKRILEGWDICCMKEIGIHIDAEENGTTFRDNALIKARALDRVLREQGIRAYSVSDDSGLCIDALDGRPGVYSARFMGEDTPYSIKNQALIDALKDVEEEKRTARFVCSIAVITPDGEEMTVQDTIEGRIAYEAAGCGGFGYDPIFYVPEYGKTTAELNEDEKNAISHRGKAIQKMKQLLQ